ncbi:hypothetical protein AZE42_10822 [Rhizopogon vesiculosus]|uniref:Myb-like domain-containing protein n=1 Tax=Rhizopogon vesiculosus TaxID=180088 RepID=A0A1J8PXV8_9AGAM|nr:hypothetical protein AZE42_10822 [Rhizopogon vesiculosus]
MTCSQKSAHGGLELTEPKDRCVWTEGDETALIEYITANRSKGSDGMNFDKTFWAAAAANMVKYAGSGATKTGHACQTKWRQVCHATTSPLVKPSLISDELLALR